MTSESWFAVAFYVIAALLVVGALAVVLLPRIVHAALALVFSFFMISGVYVLLNADFIAAAQVIIYVGAITVLFLFAIMLTNRSYAADSNPENAQWGAAAVIALLTFALTAFVFLSSRFPTRVSVPSPAVADVTGSLGQLLMGPYLLPFEIAGLLLLAAMIGAIVIAREV